MTSNSGDSSVAADSAALDTLRLIREIAVDVHCPAECPNYANRPKFEGCGLATCLDQIVDLSERLIAASGE